MIGPQTYSKIVEASVDLVTDQYVQLTHETRKKQRENFKDPNKYIDLLNDYLVNSEGLVTQSQYALAEKLGISSKKFEMSEEVMAKRGLEGSLMGIQSMARMKLKDSITSSKEVSI